MYRYRHDLEYYYLCYRRCLIIKRSIQIGTAIVSSAAIGAWVVYTNLAFIWSLIIVVSQVVTAVYDVLPIKKRTDVLAGMIAQTEQLYYEIEETWRRISYSEYSDEKINSLLTKYEKSWILICNKALADDMLPQKEKLSIKAEDEAREYFRIFNEEN